MFISKLFSSFCVAVFAIFFGIVTATVHAESIHDQRQRAEASMLVTGEVVVTPTGEVRNFKLDHADELPPPVKTLIAKAMQQWRFEPVSVNGQAVNAKAQMNLRIVAKQGEGGANQYTIRIGSAYFGDDRAGHDKTAQGITMHILRKPAYPQLAIDAHVGGTVYLLARLDADGKVDKIGVEQVNLTAVGLKSVVKRLREAFATASINAVSHWTFTSHDSEAGRIVRVPLRFNINGRDHQEPRYGHWASYIPGRRALLPWADSAQVANGGVDALPAGTAAAATQKLHLKTSLDPS